MSAQQTYGGLGGSQHWSYRCQMCDHQMEGYGDPQLAIEQHDQRHEWQRKIERLPAPLCRRDEFAKAALQGLLASSTLQWDGTPIINEAVFETAVLCAHRLMAELDKAKP
jgi:hypothetical protein